MREFLSRSDKKNPFDHEEIYDILDLCLSCKACKSECPSNVDVLKLKAEFLQHYYDANGIPLRSRMIANITVVNQFASICPSLYDAIMNFAPSAFFMKKMGFSTKRTLPSLYKTTLDKWFKKKGNSDNTLDKKVYLFNDEFTRFKDAEIGIKTILLLNALGYQVIIPEHEEKCKITISCNY